jgi:hypothetical protein
LGRPAAGSISIADYRTETAELPAEDAERKRGRSEALDALAQLLDNLANTEAARR